MWKTFSQIALLITSIGLLIINIALQRHNRELLSTIANLESAEGPPISSSLPWISGNDLNDELTMFDFSERTGRTLLLLFSSGCGYTKQNWPYWHRLLKESPSTNVVFADTTGEVTAAYFREAGIATPERVIKIAGLMKSECNLRVTPTTVVLGPKGRVEGVWIGVLSDEKVKGIKELLRAHDNPRLAKEESQ